MKQFYRSVAKEYKTIIATAFTIKTTAAYSGYKAEFY